jgi:ubiquinone/menaquinone biosynthesis C-methylase UbiE
MNDFNFVAPVYDRLARIVFGNRLREIQLIWLDLIPKDANVLIMGGGTGWILDEINKIKPQVHIDYVEASAKMVELSGNRPIDMSDINLIYGNEANIPRNRVYDVIITNFFLDVFEIARLNSVLKKLNLVLSGNGILICSDFQMTKQLRHRFLIWLMHRFFGLVSGMESKHLKDLPKHIQESGFLLKEQATAYNGLLFSNVYVKV